MAAIKKDEPAQRFHIPKVPTYVPGLDNILHGGIPMGRTTVLSGGVGCGKSTLALQTSYQHALHGDPVIFVTFEESAEAMRQNARTMGWDIQPLEETGKLFLMQARITPGTVMSGEFSLQGLFGILGGKAREMGAELVVIDALDVLLRVFPEDQKRNELYALRGWLGDEGLTTLLTVKIATGDDFAPHAEFLHFLADCVVRMDQRVVDQVTTRRLRVIKYRGSAFGSNEYPFVLSSDGVITVPISAVTLEHSSMGKPIPTGCAKLDEILGGGIRRSSVTLITGTSGTGKTTLACTMVQAACQRGERALYFSFEESQDMIIDNMQSPGIDLGPAVAADLLRFSTALPEAAGAEQHLVRSIADIEAFQPQLVVVDAISACLRMGSELAAFEFVMRLTNACKRHGITMLLLNQAEDALDRLELSGVGVSSLVDGVIILRHVNTGSTIRATLLVLKARGAKHSRDFFELEITDAGITLREMAFDQPVGMIGINSRRRMRRTSGQEGEGLL